MADEKEMDAAAQIAEEELKTKISAKSVEDVAAWWQKHYSQAGHKRLGRLLVRIGKGK